MGSDYASEQATKRQRRGGGEGDDNKVCFNHLYRPNNQNPPFTHCNPLNPETQNPQEQSKRNLAHLNKTLQLFGKWELPISNFRKIIPYIFFFIEIYIIPYFF